MIELWQIETGSRLLVLDLSRKVREEMSLEWMGFSDSGVPMVSNPLARPPQSL